MDIEYRKKKPLGRNCRIQKFNMKCEIERMEINYTFYFFAFLKKTINKLLIFYLLNMA